MKKGGLNCSHQSHQLLCNAVKVYHPRFLTLSSTKQTNIWLNKKNKKIRPGEDRKLNFNYVKIMSATLKSSNKTTKWSRKLRKRCILVWSTKQNKNVGRKVWSWCDRKSKKMPNISRGKKEISVQLNQHNCVRVWQQLKSLQKRRLWSLKAF